MKNVRWIVPLCALAWAGAGCAGLTQRLPADYFEPRRTMAIAVAGGLPRPTLHTDPPQSQIAGSPWLARNQAMQNRMGGIAPAQIHAAIEQALAKRLADAFDVVPGGAQLALTVAIDDWGWYVPTGKYGESRDGHCFRIGGTAAIADLDPARGGEEIFFTYNSTDTPLDDRLTKEKCEAALPQAADDFAAQIVRFILQGRPAAGP